MISLGVRAATDKAAAAVVRRVQAAADPALARALEPVRKRAESQWYGLVNRISGESGQLRVRVYRTGAGTLRAKIGSDSKYARWLFAPGRSKRVIDLTLTDPLRKGIGAGFRSELAKGLK